MARPLGIPALADAFALFAHFEDGPEAAAGCDSQDGRPEDARAEYGGYGACYAADGENPVAFLAQVIFSLDYQGVEEADYEEGAEADGDAQQPVLVQEFSHL